MALRVPADMGDVHGAALCYGTSSAVTGVVEDSVSYYAHAFYRAPAGRGEEVR